jgi:hypothetical protein
VSDIEPGVNYKFSITAQNAQENAISTPFVYEFIKEMEPLAPVSLGVEKTSSKNTLTWVNGGDRGSAVLYYQVEKLNSVDNSWELY